MPTRSVLFVVACATLLVHASCLDIKPFNADLYLSEDDVADAIADGDAVEDPGPDGEPDGDTVDDPGSDLDAIEDPGEEATVDAEVDTVDDPGPETDDADGEDIDADDTSPETILDSEEADTSPECVIPDDCDFPSGELVESLCTDRDCVDGTCTFAPLSDGSDCTASEVCVAPGGTCSAGICTGAATATCESDQAVCFEATCSIQTGQCSLALKDGWCLGFSEKPVGLGIEGFSDLNLLCLPEGETEYSGCRLCQDGELVPVGTGQPCDDGFPCTLDDVCVDGNEPAGCVGTPKTCSDGVDCTVDWCEAETGTCVFEDDVVGDINLTPMVLTDAAVVPTASHSLVRTAGASGLLWLVGGVSGTQTLPDGTPTSSDGFFYSIVARLDPTSLATASHVELDGVPAVDLAPNLEFAATGLSPISADLASGSGGPPFTIPSPEHEAYVVRYDPGGTPIWGLRFDSTGTPEAVRLTANSTVVLLSHDAGVSAPGVGGEVAVQAEALHNLALIQFGPTGTALWANNIVSSSGQLGNPRLSIDPGTGRLWLAVHFNSPTKVADTTYVPDGEDALLVSLYASGDIAWARHLKGDGAVAVRGIDPVSKRYLISSPSEVSLGDPAGTVKKDWTSTAAVMVDDQGDALWVAHMTNASSVVGTGQVLSLPPFGTKVHKYHSASDTSTALSSGHGTLVLSNHSVLSGAPSGAAELTMEKPDGQAVLVPDGSVGTIGGTIYLAIDYPDELILGVPGATQTIGDGTGNGGAFLTVFSPGDCP